MNALVATRICIRILGDGRIHHQFPSYPRFPELLQQWTVFIDYAIVQADEHATITATLPTMTGSWLTIVSLIKLTNPSGVNDPCRLGSRPWSQFSETNLRCRSRGFLAACLDIYVPLFLFRLLDLLRPDIVHSAGHKTSSSRPANGSVAQ